MGIVAEMQAALVDVRPGQIYPVMIGNGGQHIEETIAEALWKAVGRKSIAASWLGMSRRSLVARIAESETLLELLEDIEEMRNDLSEVQLDALILAGSEKAVLFHLKTKAKHRGYGESREVKSTVSFTLDAARQLDQKFSGAFDAIRIAAADAVTAVEAVEPPDEDEDANHDSGGGGEQAAPEGDEWGSLED